MDLIHQVEVILGPLAEHEGRGSPGDAFRIVSSGAVNDLRVQFSCKRTFGGAPNRSELIITNLSEQSRNLFRRGLTRVEVNAGYLNGDNAGLRKVTTGGISSALPTDSAPEIETIVSFLDGFGGMSRGVFRRSFRGGVPLSTVVKAVAESMPGVTVGESHINIQGVTGASGRTFAGRAADILDDLGAQWGFSWSIQNGVFQALDDFTPLSTTHLMSYRDGSLRSVKPILTGPLEIPTGVEIVGRLNPRINPGERVRVESLINSSLNGVYTVHEHDLSGNSHGNPWDSKIRTLNF